VLLVVGDRFDDALMATVHRFYVEPPLAGGIVELPAQLARQMAAVLRLEPGDPVVLFDGTGGEWQAEIATLAKGRATARLIRHVDLSREAPLRLTLCQALIKADRFEWVLQKGTELGVAEFVPLLTRRVVGASGKARAGRVSAAQRETERILKLERWRRIIIEAAEQSGRTAIPAVSHPQTLRTVLASGRATIFCWEAEGGSHPFRVALAQALERSPDQVQVLIGPEGGFTPQEVEAALAAGALPASFGKRILRSETAGIAAAALALLA
jgi:16S rRNA (uracil1498-N3)-methyltransferase